jgi:hypothetical protein
MVYPADDLLLRARLVRKAAEERVKPMRELVHEIAGLITEVEARARENATSAGTSPPPGSGCR